MEKVVYNNGAINDDVLNVLKSNDLLNGTFLTRIPRITKPFSNVYFKS
jgi:hypothetical protein